MQEQVDHPLITSGAKDFTVQAGVLRAEKAGAEAIEAFIVSDFFEPIKFLYLKKLGLKDEKESHYIGKQ